MTFPSLTRRSLLAAALSFGAGIAAAPAIADDVPNIAAAADLQFALRETAAAFAEATGRSVNLTFGSSGNFFRQIREGAPFEMFLSADEQFVLDLAKGGLAADDGTLYAVGRIVLFVPNGSALKADGQLEDLKAALADGRLTRFAIANPEHAPYGRRAEEALRTAGLWDAIELRLVFGENVSQAAQFATSGNAEGGMIAYSIALAPDVARLGTFALISQDWHQPLRQRMALLKGHGETAKMFFAFMQEDAARAIMKRYGFVLPGETM